jgi:hypothetical protein
MKQDERKDKSDELQQTAYTPMMRPVRFAEFIVDFLVRMYIRNRPYDSESTKFRRFPYTHHCELHLVLRRLIFIRTLLIPSGRPAGNPFLPS